MLKHLKFKNMIINTNSWHQTIFPAGNPTSIFAFNTFHYQVRYGLKWFHINEGTKKKNYSCTILHSKMQHLLLCKNTFDASNVFLQRITITCGNSAVGSWSRSHNRAAHVWENFCYTYNINYINRYYFVNLYCFYLVGLMWFLFKLH